MSHDAVADLGKVPLFSRLSEQALTELAGRCRRLRFPAREALFHEGDPGGTLYLVLSGAIDVTRVAPSGEIVHIARRGPGESVGELSLLDDAPRSADVATAEPSELLALNREEFRRCLEQTPLLALDLMACLARRLREASSQRVSQQALDATGRLAELLLQEVALHGVPSPKGGTRITVHLTHQEIADRVGIARETASRLLSRLRAVGAVRVEEGCLVVVSSPKLRRYSTA